MKKLIITIINALSRRQDPLSKNEQVKKVEVKKDLRAYVLLGISMDFHWGIINFPKEGEDEEIKNIVEYNKQGDGNYDLKNWCCRSYHLGSENVEKIIQILTTQAQCYPQVETLKQKGLSRLQMLTIVRGFIEQMPLPNIEEIMSSVQNGAVEYFEQEKGIYADGKHDNSMGKRFLDLSKRIETNEDSLMIATGMCVSSILSDMYGKSGIAFFP